VAAVSWKLLRDLQRSHEQPEMGDAPEAPTEVPAAQAPSPVGPAPELLHAPPAAHDGAAAQGDADEAPQESVPLPSSRFAEIVALAMTFSALVSDVLRWIRDRFGRGKPSGPSATAPGSSRSTSELQTTRR
jgi:hypothetical protein